MGMVYGVKNSGDGDRNHGDGWGWGLVFVPVQLSSSGSVGAPTGHCTPWLRLWRVGLGLVIREEKVVAYYERDY